MTIHRQVGATVKRIREENSLSQETLAHRANLNRSYLGEVERGVAIPSINTVSKIAFALNLKVADLIRLSEEQEETVS